MSAISFITRLLPLVLVLLLLACQSDEQNADPISAPPLHTAESLNIYVVKPNDTLYAIGKAHKKNYQTLAKLNAIAPPYTLAVGQKIKLSEQSVAVENPTQKSELNNTSKETITYAVNLTEAEFKKQQKKLALESESPSENMETETAPVFYTVKKNETLYSLSRRFGLTPQLLAALNNITAPEQLHAGQKIKISKSKQKHSLAKSAENITEIKKNTRDLSHKTSIISINNESMLKLYHQLPASGEILKNFHASGNRGIEIGGKLGQPVKAVAEGRVAAIKPAIYGYGVFIVIEHGEGYLSSYANNRSALVKVGQKVRQGQVIAQMGQIGRNRPSVEFEIRKNGQLYDPMRFLAKQK